MDSPIPLQTICYMLCYAWDKLNEMAVIRVNAVPGENLFDLYARMLIDATNHALRRGIDKSYVVNLEKHSTLRGKIDFPQSLKHNSFRYAQAYCEFSTLNVNILHNQILKSTMRALLKVTGLAEELHDNLAKLYREFYVVEEIVITSRCFSQVKLNRNNRFYDIILAVCKLVYEDLLPGEPSNRGKYDSVLFDDENMDRLFEEFIRNFFRKEQRTYSVRQEIVKWDAIPLQPESEDLLPFMRTDASLESATGKIVLETKFYKDCLQEYWGRRKLISENLYQLFSYMKNLERKGGINVHCKGILIYPQIGDILDLAYEIQGHTLMVKTINLHQEWTRIKEDLIRLIS